MTKQCSSQAYFRYTWPGRDESFVCEKCAQQLAGIADAMGFYLQLIPLMSPDPIRQCQQQVRDEQ